MLNRIRWLVYVILLFSDFAIAKVLTGAQRLRCNGTLPAGGERCCRPALRIHVIEIEQLKREPKETRPEELFIA